MTRRVTSPAARLGRKQTQPRITWRCGYVKRGFMNGPPPPPPRRKRCHDDGLADAVRSRSSARHLPVSPSDRSGFFFFFPRRLISYADTVRVRPSSLVFRTFPRSGGGESESARSGAKRFTGKKTFPKLPRDPSTPVTVSRSDGKRRRDETLDGDVFKNTKQNERETNRIRFDGTSCDSDHVIDRRT